ADDPHWEVREAAAGLLGTLLDRDFERIRTICEEWRSSRSENLRRAVVLGVKYAARRDKPDRVPDLMRILEPLLRDPTPYVRRNRGAGWRWPRLGAGAGSATPRTSRRPGSAG